MLKVNTERFLAFLTPQIRSLAKSVAKKIKKDKAVAATMVWLVLEDVIAHKESSIAEDILKSMGGEDSSELAERYVGEVSRDNSVTALSRRASLAWL